MIRHFLSAKFLPVLWILSFSLVLSNASRAQFRRSLPEVIRNVTPAYHDPVQASRIPVLKAPLMYLGRSLPAILDNSKNTFFSGIMDQNNYATCEQVAGVCYTFAYEINRLRGLNGHLTDNKYSPHYTWNFLNGVDQYIGVGFLDSWEIIKNQGQPSDRYYPPEDSMKTQGWLTGYQNYYPGMSNRIRNIWSIPVNTEEGILTLKNYLYDHLDGSPAGGIAAYSASPLFTDNLKIIPAGSPEAGKSVLIGYYPVASHGMTIVGYNDSIRYDLNGDSRFTNDIDINNDGIVDPKDWEIGAYIMANSYGAWWEDEGRCYVLYRAMALDFNASLPSWTGTGGIWNHSVYVVDPDTSYHPLLTMKVNLDFTSRNKLRILAGIAADTSHHQPEQTLSFPIFKFQGGNHFMQGRDSIPSQKNIEFGLDVTPLLSHIRPGETARFFLGVDERDSAIGGTGKVNALSFIDYSNGAREIVCPETNVPIAQDDVTFMSATGSTGFDKVRITTMSLPGVTPTLPYQVQLDAEGGYPPYTWTLLRTYETSITDSLFPVNTGGALVPVNDGIRYSRVALPFSFPFYGKLYDTIYVNGFGFIAFDPQHFPGPYLKMEEEMLRNMKTISPAFAYNYAYDDQHPFMWCDASPARVTIWWKLAVKDHTGNSENNFALRLYPGGDFEFLYGNIINTGFTERTYSGFSNGDDQNVSTWPNWDFNTLANQSYRFHEKTMPPGTSVTENGVLTISGADSSITYNLPVRVTDSRRISDTRNFSYSQELVIDEEIESENNVLEFGKPAWFNLKITNNGQSVLNNIQIVLRTPETAVSISDSTHDVASIGVGEMADIDHAFALVVDSLLPNQYPIPFRILCTSGGHQWMEDVTLFISAPQFSIGSVVVDDCSNGLLEPGEVADLVFQVRNAIGAANAKDITLTLIPDDTLVRVLSASVQAIDEVIAGSGAEVRFQVAASRNALPGSTAPITLVIGNSQTGSLGFQSPLLLGKVPVALIQLTDHTNSGDSMASILDDLGLNYTRMNEVPEKLNAYSSVFVLPGTASSGNHDLLPAENLLLSGYLNNGGFLYMEEWSGNWNMGTSLQIHSYFKYHSDHISLYFINEFSGLTGTPGEGMTFRYTSPENYSVFDFEPVSPAFSFFSIPASPTVLPVIGYGGNDYRTIGSIVEFGSLHDSTAPSVKKTLMERYLDFFGVNYLGPFPFFHSDSRTVTAYSSVSFFDDSFDNIISRSWEFTGGNPDTSSLQTPVVLYELPGVYDVKLTVSDGMHTRSILKKEYVTVQPNIGIRDPGFAENNFFTTYPNPAKTLINIDFLVHPEGPVQISMLDLQGRKVLSESIYLSQDHFRHHLDISHLDPGIYLLKVSSSSFSATGKVIAK